MHGTLAYCVSLLVHVYNNLAHDIPRIWYVYTAAMQIIMQPIPQCQHWAEQGKLLISVSIYITTATIVTIKSLALHMYTCTWVWS